MENNTEPKKYSIVKNCSKYIIKGRKFDNLDNLADYINSEKTPYKITRSLQDKEKSALLRKLK